MITIQTDCTVALPCGVNNIKGLTINCCDFLFLDRSGCNLIKWSKSTQSPQTIPLTRRYLCVCYDAQENCYWAIPEGATCLIYRLDLCFCEVGSIEIKGAYQQRAISLCYDACKNGLWICYPCQLAFVEKCSGNTTWEKAKDSCKINLGLIVQQECRAACYYEGSRQILEVTCGCYKEAAELCISKEYKIMGIASCFCGHKGKECRFCILLSKSCSHEFMLADYCVTFAEGTMTPCCPCSCPCPVPPRPPKPHPGGKYEIMHSIALEEAGIAHILNAEGEKIQKAVAMSDNIEDLICVNESVKRTLTQVTLLEGMLYSKLETLTCSDCCYGINPDPPCPPEPPCCVYDEDDFWE